MTTITLPRAVVEQALEVINDTAYGAPVFRQEVRDTITALRAALAQQAEPVAGKVVAWGVFANIDGEWQLQHPVFAGDEQGKVNAEFERASYSGPQPLEVRPLGVVTATAQQAEPAQEPVAWVASKDGRVIYDYVSADDCLLRVSGDFENDEQRVRYAQRIVDKLNAALAQQAEPVAWMFELARNFNLEGYGGWEKRITEYRPNTPEGSVRNVTPLYAAPPQRKPLTEKEIKTAFHAARNAKLGASQDNSRHRLSVIEIARAVEKASWEKNHGQA